MRTEEFLKEWLNLKERSGSGKEAKRVQTTAVGEEPPEEKLAVDTAFFFTKPALALAASARATAVPAWAIWEDTRGKHILKKKEDNET
jgi:hypothetical protein